MGDASVEKTFNEVKSTIDSNNCVMYSSTTCPWCDRANDFITKFGKQCKKIELNAPENRMTGAVVAAATNQRTVPNIFIEGELMYLYRCSLEGIM